jgi:hypothetical protein
MNVQEILLLNKERKLKTKVNIDKLLENIHKRIKNYALLKKESCTYIVPPIINGLPVFDVQEVTLEIFKKLDSEGYIVNAYSNGTLEICWNEKLVEQKVRTDSYVLSLEEKRLKNITKKHKNVDKRFEFLANPKKTVKELSIDDELDLQLEKILKEKQKHQNKFKKLL